MAFIDGQRVFARVVWYERDQGRTFVEIALRIWELLPALDSRYTDNVRKIRKIKDESTQQKEICMWLKGIVDNILISVHTLKLTEDYLNDPKKYTQGYCHELKRALRENSVEKDHAIRALENAKENARKYGIEC